MTISKGYSSLLISLLNKERAYTSFMVRESQLNNDYEEVCYWSEQYMSVIGLLDEIHDQIDE